MKYYRIRVTNPKTGEKMLIWERFRSRKAAEKRFGELILTTPRDVAKFEIIQK